MVNVQRKELKGGSLDAKFTAADHNGKMISVSDNVKVLEGSLKVFFFVNNLPVDVPCKVGCLTQLL